MNGMVARSRSTDQRYYGVYEGIVSNVNDPGQEGRIKVKMPWFDHEMETEWCRVRQFYAGNGYGAFFIPEVGNEVLLSFIQGDMRQPIILGGLYNGVDKPPTHHADDLDQKMLRTKAGHVFLLDDTEGKERVQITTKGGHKIDFSDGDEIVSITSSSGNTIALDDRGGQITIKTSGGESVTLSGGVAKVSAATVVLSGASVKLGGDGAGFSAVLGEPLLAWLASHTHVCTLPGTPSSPMVPPAPPVPITSTVTKTV